MRILIIFVLLYEQIWRGWNSTSYKPYSSEAYPHLTHLEFTWRYYDNALSLVPILFAAIIHTWHKRAPHHALLWISRIGLATGVIMLIVSAVIRYADGPYLFDDSVWLIALVLILFHFSRNE